MAALIPRLRCRVGLKAPPSRWLRAAIAGLLCAVLAGCASTPPHVGAVLVAGSRVQDAGGEVQVVREGSAIPARPGLELETGDEIHTGPSGQAVLSLEGGRVEVIVFEGTQVRLGSIFTEVGKVVVRVLKKVKDKFEVESEYAVAGAESTAFLVGVGPDEEYRCAVIEGLVRLRSPTGQWPPVELAGGQEAVVRPGTPLLTRRELDPGELNDLVGQVNNVLRAYRDTAELLVPDLTGLPLAEARRTLEASGLTAGDAANRITGTAAVGTVVEQSPAPGGRVSSRGRVELVVEAEPTTVPPVVGLPLRDAEARLVAAGLRSGSVREEITGARGAGEVLRQEPGPDRQVPVGSEVALWVEAQSVVVPSLVKVDVRRAGAELRQVGLRARTDTRLVEGAADGVVLEQRPDPGARVRPGTTVSLLVAERGVRVPDLVGSSRRVLERALAGRDLSVGQVSSRPGRGTPGTVVEQNPRPGTLVRPGTPVHVTVATHCTVPNVRGMTRDAAFQALSRANLRGRVGFVGQYRQKEVTSQDPRAGTRVECGSTVTIGLGVIG